MKLNQLTFIALCLTGAVAFAPAQDATTPAHPQYSPEQIFKFWDTNGDGKLTPNEVPNANLLKLLDKNGDGTVTKDEAAAIGKWGAGQPGAKPAGQGAKSAADWKGLGVSPGAPLPPADQFQPRRHGDEAANAARSGASKPFR